MKEITYSLKRDDDNSDGYYSRVRTFTGKVLDEGTGFLPLIEEFKIWLQKNHIEEPRENEEYLLELLSFGVLWQTYGHIALVVRFAPFRLMSALAEWRKKHQKLKPYIDNLRGILVTLFLFPKLSSISYQLSAKEPAPPPSMKQLSHVYKWFMATGEFREQALRFINWRKFWQEKPATEILAIFNTIESFTFWFKDNAMAELGKYTENLNGFLQKAHDDYKWREDRVQCMRSEAEYHLNMVGAELMNKALRDEFKLTAEKAVLLPGCMRKIPAEGCKAVRVPGGLKCIGCTPDCHVNRLRETGKKENFTVYVIPHASDLTQWSPSKQHR
ncbi:MAG TPA: DUF116 domain-containing protein, partial [Prolixibacteraceae bacterium]|nr:DUF116 domain-containing protein [Prolixibacteraceae bacterium]